MPKRTKKKGGAVDPTVQEYADRISNYIEYCERLQKLYDKKHNEVRTLTNYLIEIDRDFPDVPVNHQIVNDILRAIKDLPTIHLQQQKLSDLDKAQNVLMAQAKNNRRVIHRKINELRKSTGNAPVTPPADLLLPPPGFGGPPRPPAPRLGVPTSPTLPPKGPGGVPRYLAPARTRIPPPLAGIGGPQYPQTGTRNLPNPPPPSYSPPGSAVLPGFPSDSFLNMKKQDPFNIKDYKQHLENNNMHNFDFIPVKGLKNLYLMTYYDIILNDESTFKEIKDSLNHVQTVIGNVRILQEKINNLCQRHERTSQQYIQVLKIPFKNEANKNYPSDKGMYYTNLIERTSELFGYLLKIEKKLQIYDLLYKYQDLFYFLKLLISISPKEYIPEIKLSEGEIDLINKIPQTNLDLILPKSPGGDLINTGDLLKNVELSREVIIEYFKYLLTPAPAPAPASASASEPAQAEMISGKTSFNTAPSREQEPSPAPAPEPAVKKSKTLKGKPESI